MARERGAARGTVAEGPHGEHYIRVHISPEAWEALGIIRSARFMEHLPINRDDIISQALVKFAEGCPRLAAIRDALGRLESPDGDQE